MKLIWSKSSSPLSLLIRFICKEDCSHFSFVFESEAKGLMFESNLLGTHPSFLQTSLKTHSIVHEIDLPLSISEEDLLWDVIVDKYDGHSYDFLGALYLGWFKFLKRVFGIKLPDKNKWCQPGQYFCDQLYDCLNNIPRLPKINVMNGMDTPHDVWIRLSAIL